MGAADCERPLLGEAGLVVTVSVELGVVEKEGDRDRGEEVDGEEKGRVKGMRGAEE